MDESSGIHNKPVTQNLKAAPVTQNLKASIKPQGELLEGRQYALHPCVSPSPGQDRARVSDQ